MCMRVQRFHQFVCVPKHMRLYECGYGVCSALAKQKLERDRAVHTPHHTHTVSLTLFVYALRWYLHSHGLRSRKIVHQHLDGGRCLWNQLNLLNRSNLCVCGLNFFRSYLRLTCSFCAELLLLFPWFCANYRKIGIFKETFFHTHTHTHTNTTLQ